MGPSRRTLDANIRTLDLRAKQWSKVREMAERRLAGITMG